MIKPTIHMNGTAGMDLYALYVAAHEKLTQAIVAMTDAGPHARDYYPQGDDAFRVAAREHTERLKSLVILRNEMETLALHCTRETHRK